MSTSAFNAEISGHSVIAAPQASHGGAINIHNHYGGSTAPPVPQPFSTVPFQPDPDFVERPSITAWLNDHLTHPASRAALVGLGGIGKSQMAIQYAHTLRQSQPDLYVFWVHASTKSRFEEAYRTLAERLRLPRRHDPNINILRLMHDWMCNEENGRWLVILDNADDAYIFSSNHNQDQTIASTTPLPLTSFLPLSANGRILITSRSTDAAAAITGDTRNILPMRTMDETQGLQLLRSKLCEQHDEEVAVDLLQALEYLPLAITQASAYVVRRAPRMTPSIFLEALRSNKNKKTGLLKINMPDLRRDPSASNSIVATWQMTFQAIQQERPSAADLLIFMSFFSPQGIPEWVLRSYAASRTHQDAPHIDCSNESQEDSEHGDEFDDDLEILQGYSLVATIFQEGILEMHALVQFCTQAWASSFDDIKRRQRTFLEIISREYPMGHYEHWTKCQMLDPHIGPLVNAEPENDTDAKNLSLLLRNVGWYRREMGLYSAAVNLLQKAVCLRKKCVDEDVYDTLKDVEILAIALQSQGKQADVEPILQLFHKCFNDALGKEHPETLRSVHNLAVMLQTQGKYAEAEIIMRQALDGKEKTRGKEHPDTLASANELASILEDQGKFTEAEAINRRVLDGLEKTLGAEHPSTLRSVNGLASILHMQNKLVEAELMSRRALDGRQKTLGGEHPDTLISADHLATVLHAQGKYAAAEAMNLRALDGMEKALGKDHVRTLTCVHDLAAVLTSQGKHIEAEAVEQRALDGYERVLGKEHPTTLIVAYTLAAIVRAQGKYAEAEAMNRAILHIVEKVLGQKHPDILMSARHLEKNTARTG